MKEYRISSREAGQRMDKYLAKLLDQAPKSFLYKMLRKKNIVLNDKKAAGSEILKEQDLIRIYFSDETFSKFSSGFHQSESSRDQISEHYRKWKSRVGIVYEDENILVLNKPSGLLSQKARENDYSANEFVIDYLMDTDQLSAEEYRSFHPSVCNRLDRNTSGLLLAGKTIHGLQSMGKLLQSRELKKYYRCVVAGVIREDAYLKGYLKKDRQTNIVEICREPVPGAQPIETAYHPVKICGDRTLLEVHLITGRSHQIRAHLASVGHPILGDVKYGNEKMNGSLPSSIRSKGQLLHAYRMEFPDGRVMVAEEPETFAIALGKNEL